MKIVSLGGGPAGLYFSLLMKKAFPDAVIDVYERNRPEDTFGWGVVFSDETLGAFGDADAESYAEITAQFKHWTDIETYYQGTCTTSTGHGFSALSRKKLLLILHERCRSLGIGLHFEQEIDDLSAFSDADLILGADGVNSGLREKYAEHFRPSLDQRKCRFCWLGTTKPLDAFTFIFKESEHGLFQVHAYPFEDHLSTWIVECREETWQRAGLDQASENDTVAFCEELFRQDLAGHGLLTNRSLWRVFPTVRCETWHLRRGEHGAPSNVILLGDSAHTAHFSIGSGTKLAMEDAILLAQTFQELGTEDVPAALKKYEDDRWVDVLKLQKAAQTSLEWFENSQRYMEQDPLQFNFNLMTRSKRITWENLRERDPESVDQVDAWFRQDWEESSGSDRRVVQADGPPPPPMFTPYRIDSLELDNRIVISPMCQYSAEEGVVGDWHLQHYCSRAIGGAGLLITEMTDVEAAGRITKGCAGIYTDEQRDAWKRIVDFIHKHSRQKVGIQLAHAGRKGSVHHPWNADDRPLTAEEGAWTTYGPSAIPFRPEWPAPKEMDRGDMDRVVKAFEDGARRADEAGFDLIEFHMAHGYLLSSFLSPLSNRRDDEYGGSLENRLRFPLEVFRAVRAVWPAEKPLIARISATDWLDDEDRGMTAEESVVVAKALKAAGCALIDVSTAGNSMESKPIYGRMYQVPFAEKIRYEADMPVMAVGAILGEDHANTILAAGRADLIAMARPHLRDPYLTLHAAARYEVWDVEWPGQYVRGRPMPK